MVRRRTAPSRTMWPDCCLKIEVDARSGRRCPSFEPRPPAAPQDEVVTLGTKSDPHGEEAHRAVSNHGSSSLRSRPSQRPAGHHARVESRFPLPSKTLYGAAATLPWVNVD